MLEERKGALERDVQLKARSVMDADEKLRRIQDEFDLKMYLINDQTKEITAQRLKIDVVETKCEGMLAEKRHLEVQLKEALEFKELFEIDNAKLRDEYT